MKRGCGAAVAREQVVEVKQEGWDASTGVFHPQQVRVPMCVCVFDHVCVRARMRAHTRACVRTRAREGE